MLTRTFPLSETLLWWPFRGQWYIGSVRPQLLCSTSFSCPPLEGEGEGEEEADRRKRLPLKVVFWMFLLRNGCAFFTTGSPCHPTLKQQSHMPTIFLVVFCVAFDAPVVAFYSFQASAHNSAILLGTTTYQFRALVQCFLLFRKLQFKYPSLLGDSQQKYRPWFAGLRWEWNLRNVTLK